MTFEKYDTYSLGGSRNTSPEMEPRENAVPTYEVIPTSAAPEATFPAPEATFPAPFSPTAPFSPSTPTFPPSTPEPAPTAGGEKDLSKNSSSDDDGGARFMAVVPFVAVLLCFVGYRSFRGLQRRREQHLLNMRSAQADAVLGDMQMVPSEDPDQELL
mmetsp:Transcript_20118/g.25938  ORF Transcript_20118/g.25938 Transcript_20118/m.25938 type:complete len:158 (-) Transcript_20118:49-522(-)